jgi:hypothetical protein
MKCVIYKVGSTSFFSVAVVIKKRWVSSCRRCVTTCSQQVSKKDLLKGGYEHAKGGLGYAKGVSYHAN